MTEIVRGTVKVFFTEDRPARSGKSGFGFIRRDDGEPDVFVAARRLGGLISQFGENGLCGLRVVFQTADGRRGLYAYAVQTVDAWEEEQRQAAEAERYWSSLEVSMDPPGFVVDGEVVPFREGENRGAPRELVTELIACHQEHFREQLSLSSWEGSDIFRYRSTVGDQQRLEEFLTAQTLKEKFERVRNASPLSFGEMPLSWRDVTRVTLPAEVSQVVVRYSTWDNDAKEVSTRRGAKSLVIFHSESSWVEHQEVSKDSGPALVHVEARVEKGGRLSWEEVPTFGAHVTLTRYSAVASEASMRSDYHVSVEGAEMLWAEYCPWHLSSREWLEEARHQARRVFEARRVWGEEFPGVEPGDLQAAVKSLDLDPEYAVVASWVTKIAWYVPPFLLMEEEEFWAERRRRQE